MSRVNIAGGPGNVSDSAPGNFVKGFSPPLFLGWHAAGRINMTVMTIDLNFPSAAEKFLREVADYRGFSPAGRLEALFQLSSLCDSIRAASPHLKKQIELLDRNEELEHQAWRDLIARHERRGTVADHAY